MRKVIDKTGQEEMQSAKDTIKQAKPVTETPLLPILPRQALNLPQDGQRELCYESHERNISKRGINPQVFMSKNLLVYGLIPARAGSQGLPGKNRMKLGDLSLVGHACQQALASRLTRTFLDSDDASLIEDTQRSFPDVIVPYVRPAHLSLGSSEAMEVIEHFLQWVEKSPYPMCDAVCWLQPTTPLRTSQDIDDCLALLEEHDSVVSMVATGGMSPYKMKTITNDGRLAPVLEPLAVTNRQKLPATYICNGAVFLAKVQQLRDKKSFYAERTAGFLMPKERSVNIDDSIDFAIAQLLFEKKI